MQASEGQCPPRREAGPAEPPTRPAWRRHGLLALLVTLLLVLAGALFRSVDLVGALSEHRTALIGWAESHRMTAIAVYILTYLLVIVLSLPGAYALAVTGGFVFGLLPGMVLAALSSTIGGLAVFVLARAFVGEPVRAWLQARQSDRLLGRIERGLRENAVTYMLLLRLVPAIPFTVANVAPALMGVSARCFAVTTFFGVLPASAIMSSFGVGLGDVLDQGGRPDLTLIAEPAILVPLCGLCALAAIPLLLPRRDRLPPG